MIDEKRKFADMYLTDGETIEWYGQPNLSLKLFPDGNGVSVYGVVALLVVLAILFGITFMLQSLFIWLSFIGFIVLGVATYAMQWRKFKENVKRTRYMITNQRILLLDTQSSWHQGFRLDEIQSVKLIPAYDNYAALQLDKRLKLLPIENAVEVKSLIERSINLNA